MHNITFVGTVHEEYKNCNAEQLCEVISNKKPEVIFLEALEETYSINNHWVFDNYGVLHNKLEIKALQLYNYKAQFEYVPVLDFGMHEDFDRKSHLICNNQEIRKLLLSIYELEGKYGFEFINSKYFQEFNEKIQLISKEILAVDVEANSNKAVDDYEDNMLNNIYDYCVNNFFEKGIFLCGAAHRESIMRKVLEYNSKSEIQLNWEFLTYDTKFLNHRL